MFKINVKLPNSKLLVRAISNDDKKCTGGSFLNAKNIAIDLIKSENLIYVKVDENNINEIEDEIIQYHNLYLKTVSSKQVLNEIKKLNKSDLKEFQLLDINEFKELNLEKVPFNNAHIFYEICK